MSAKQFNRKQIIVVGAGAAGLYTAYLLLLAGYEVRVLEANTRVGGRVHTIKDRMPFKLELGAEFVHGKRSMFYEKLKEKAGKLQKEGDSVFLWRQKLLPHRQIKKLEDAKQYFADYEEFYDYHHKYEGEDISLASFLQQHDLTPTQQPDAYRWYDTFAASLGTTPKNLAMKALAVESYRWNSGEQNYRTNYAFEDVFEEWKQLIFPVTLLGKPVVMIRNFGEGVEVVTKDCHTYRADAVVVSVPLTQLKDEKITFIPALPEKKQKAIREIGMDKTGMKFFMSFSERFWGEETEFLVGMEAAHEYWQTTPKQEKAPFGLTAFIMGEKAKKYSEKDKGEILELLIDELDRLYDGAASATILDFYMLDWAKVEYIEGSYSYASVGSHKLRKALARPVDGTIFFAGEATHTSGHFATVHGALETAERAVEEIQEIHVQKG